MKSDSEGRPYVDVFLLSHPDQDHCRGLQKHFHLAPLSEYKKPESEDAEEDRDGDETEPKIVIREMWSSPMVFRRASKLHTLCDDAKAWNTEARRRVKHFRDNESAEDGDRILVLGEDENGKTDDLEDILVKVGGLITGTNGKSEATLSTLLLAPNPVGDEEDEELRAKNQSSVIMQFSIACGGVPDACLFLTGGDAEVEIWERIWAAHKQNPSGLKYDLMLTPHHCSWHSLSHDSWSDLGEDVKVSKDARKALGQAREGAFVIASSKVISDEDSDPPCARAAREYRAIVNVKEVKGEFLNTASHPAVGKVAPMVFDITVGGPMLRKSKVSAASSGSGSAIGRQPLMHG
ncbi:hypothetical protein [Archangium sp.]|uniref:hypothetical protein n=1 Tax=Archangium sp. TaxID=1872627 RepID=UPI002D3AA95D|nr:hypothetical protein [Archangium sp.]HYO56818.1 hypothetical protein [Archangium sp.]